MIRDEISEYPYVGTITRVVSGKGLAGDDEYEIYYGVMDLHMQTPEEGVKFQTSLYIVSIPLTKNSSEEWIIPRKGDKIIITRYGEDIQLTVDNAEPSQLGGISIYSTRNIW